MPTVDLTIPARVKTCNVRHSIARDKGKGGCAGEKPNNVDIQSEYESRKIENKKNTTVRPMEKFLDSLSKGTMEIL
jgi:hypothetical protein